MARPARKVAGMRTYKALTAIGLGLGLIATGVAPVSAAPARIGARHLVVSWSKAELVPGAAVLNAGGQGQTQVLSCPAAGDCTAGGFVSARVFGILWRGCLLFFSIARLYFSIA